MLTKIILCVTNSTKAHAAGIVREGSAQHQIVPLEDRNSN